MATPIDVLQRQVKEKDAQLAEKDLELKNLKKRCLQLMGENMGVQQSMQELQDLLFALLYAATDGDKPLTIMIPDFRNFMQNAQFVCDATLDGDFKAVLRFFVGGAPAELQQPQPTKQDDGQ